jgi:hypothetical protein
MLHTLQQESPIIIEFVSFKN